MEQSVNAGVPFIFIEMDKFKDAYIENEEEPLWIYAYGSLIFHPSFDPAERKIGYVSNVRREFSHASYRFGVADWPGRVATLVHHNGRRTWGVGYKITGRDKKQNAFEMLSEREIAQGYAIGMLDFIDAVSGEKVEAAVYVTALDSNLSLMDDPLDIQVSK
ncbi:unnamed protein product [Echinostoma caproni]|uniref:Gamma-glutamylcyclotransferase n=1 Tax=Echinostoma caproni TaxID=27848 RepID=A0A183AVN0_9TREM|nr:unnamed protein product [Echinostoma caproni]